VTSEDPFVQKHARRADQQGRCPPKGARARGDVPFLPGDEDHEDSGRRSGTCCVGRCSDKQCSLQ
jgi:hypothetical protein